MLMFSFTALRPFNETLGSSADELWTEQSGTKIKASNNTVFVAFMTVSPEIVSARARQLTAPRCLSQPPAENPGGCYTETEKKMPGAEIQGQIHSS